MTGDVAEPAIDETHDPARGSWVPGADGHPDFPVQNLPLGVFSDDRPPRGGIAIGAHIVDLAALADSGLLAGEVLIAAGAARGPALNPLLALGAGPRRALRRRLSALLGDSAYAARMQPMLRSMDACTLHLPATIGDYTDFYAGIHHAAAIGALFRPDQPLLPNYRYVPIGYHGRASSVRASGQPVPRPWAQVKAPDAAMPQLAPTRRLDYEVELGVWIGPGNALGQPIAIERAGGHIAGLSLLNDWSARDVQTWEYQPLGPFLAKSFLTTISPWIVTAEALAPFRVPQPARAEGDPAPLGYLDDQDDQTAGAFAIALEASLQSAAMRTAGIAPVRLGHAAATDLYWTLAQLVAHHTVNGCDLRPGDLLGTGTISGPTRAGCGSLIELSRGGADAVALPGGETRTFLEDGDTVTLTGQARRDGFVPIGFGPCAGTVVPAR